MNKFDKFGVSLLILGGVVYTIIPNISYKVFSFFLMLSGYLIIKKGG